MKKESLTAILLIFLIPQLIAQQRITVSGYVRDAETGEGLIGSTIYIEELQAGTVTNLYGFYSISVPPGSYTLQYSYIGYSNSRIRTSFDDNFTRNVELEPVPTEMNEVVIYSEAPDKNIRVPEMSVIKISPVETKVIPVILGEQDILKTIQLLPGVNSGTEGTTGFYVRGGGSDQNLIILDEAPFYSASHLMGFFSVFNSDAIKDLELYKGNAPAEFGGRLSSVLDIQMKDGDSKKFSTSGGLGLLSSRLTLETPIIKDKGSVIISGRRSYADMFLVFSKNRTRSNTDLFFYDLNAKANYTINDKNRLFLSGYFGRDVFEIKDLFALKWGNNTGTLRWNHILGNRLFLNSSIIYSNYSYGFGYNFSNNLLYINSGIRDLNLKEDFQFYINPGNTLKFGVNVIHHTFSPGEIRADNEEAFNSIFMGRKKSLETAIYLSNKLDVSEFLSINYGLRYSAFISLGPDTVYTYNDYDEIIQADAFSTGRIIQRYGTLEPRVIFNFVLNDRNSFKLSYARNAQYVHLLSNSSASLPTDIWISSSKNVKPRIADQVAAGFFRNFRKNTFETSIEAYYKKLQNQIDYQNGAEILLNKNVESQLVFGEGRTYGIEVFARKRTGRLTGWIGYTLSRTEKSMDAIEDGAWFPAKQDRTQDLALVMIYQLNDRWKLSGNWVYYTGNAVTFPGGKYTVDDFTVPAYTSRNGYRMPDYHRLDLAATYTPNKKRRFESSWNFALYNAYGHRNAFSISFRQNEGDPSQMEAIRLALFRMIPSITYNFKF